jgi:hypothetical protein
VPNRLPRLLILVPCALSAALAAPAVAVPGVASVPPPDRSPSGASSVAPGSPVDPSPWSSPQVLGSTRRSPTYPGDIGIGLRPDGRRAALVASAVPRGASGNSVVRAFEWTRHGWISRGAIPSGGSQAGAVSVQWAKSGGVALALWSGQSDEGVTDILASVRSGDAWTTAAEFGKGTPSGGVAADGSRALVAWYDEYEDSGYTGRVEAAWWSEGAWQPTTVLADYGSPTWYPRGKPQVAVAPDGSRAVIAWAQDDTVRAMWWDGATWSPELAGPAGWTPQAVRFTSGAGQSAVVMTRVVASTVEVQRVPLTPAGFGAVQALGSVDAGADAAYALKQVEVNADAGALAAVVQPFGGAALVALWPPGAVAPVVTDLGAVNSVDVALPAKGPFAFLVVHRDADPRDRIMAWDTDAWTTIRRQKTCAESGPTLAVSARGTTKVLGWACPTLSVTRTAGS